MIDRTALLRQRAALQRELADIDEQLADAERADEPAEYGSTAPWPPPPGRSHRWLRDHARHIPGARRIGGARGRGVVWVVSAADYGRWATPRHVPAGVAGDDDLDAALERAGLRATRGAA